MALQVKIVVMALVTIIAFSACGTEQFNSKFETVPANAVAGTEVKVKYKPEMDKLVDAKEISMVVYPYNSDVIDAIEIPMTKKGEGWVANYTPDAETYGCLIKFVSGDITDNNEKEAYSIKLQKDDKPVVGAIAGLGVAHMGWIRNLDIDNSTEKAVELMKSEIDNHKELASEFGGNYLATLQRAKLDNSEELMSNLAAEIEKIENPTVEDMSTLYRYYSLIQDGEKSKECYDNILKNDPANVIFQQADFMTFRAIPSVEKKLEAAKAFNTKFPESMYYKYMMGDVISGYAKAKDFKSIDNLLASNGSELPASTFNNLAWGLYEEGTNLDKALVYAQQGAKACEKEINSTEDKPKSYTDAEWKSIMKQNASMMLDTYACILAKENKDEESLKNFKLAVDYAKGEETELNENYTAQLMKMKKYDVAQKELQSFFEKGKNTSKMKDFLKEAYVENKGSEEGFEEYLSKYVQAAKEDLLAKVKSEMIDLPGVDFSLTDIDGKKVSLADFKGKVVILDFWATWCGPCKKSFPGMQKAVNKHKDNENVAFLFINTWERVENKVKNASDFVKQNNYTFNVLMDVDNKVVTDYKVSGIPTKYILDKEGKIRFKSVGFAGSDEHLVNELDAMISLLN